MNGRLVQVFWVSEEMPGNYSKSVMMLGTLQTISCSTSSREDKVSLRMARNIG